MDPRNHATPLAPVVLNVPRVQIVRQSASEIRMHVGMLAVSLLIASSFPVAASIAGDLNSMVLTLLRFALASLLFLPLVALRHRSELLPSLRSFLGYAALSAPLVAYFVAMFAALKTTTAVNTGALFTLGPGFAALFSWLIAGERLPGRRILALVIGMLGALWVVFRDEPARILVLGLAEGDVLFIAGTILFGLYTVLIRRLHRGEPMHVMTLWTLVTGTGWLLLLGWDDLVAVRWSAVEPRVFAAIAYLGVFTTLLSFLLTQMAVRVLGPMRTMAYTYLNPALVALFSWALGDTGLSWILLPGIGLTAASMLVLQRDSAAAS